MKYFFKDVLIYCFSIIHMIKCCFICFMLVNIPSLIFINDYYDALEKKKGLFLERFSEILILCLCLKTFFLL